MTIPSVTKDVEQLEILRVAGGNAKWGSHFESQSDKFLIKIYQRYIGTYYDPDFPLLGIYPKEIKH